MKKYKWSSWQLKSTAKLLANDTSLFSTVYDHNISTSQLDSDLKKKFALGFQMENDF